MPSVGEISPSLTQVHRTVIQLKRKQDMFMDGVKVIPKDITLWQQIKYITGSKVTTKDTDALVYTTDFIGSLVATTPLGNIEHENIPRFLTTESIHSLPQAVSLGVIPSHKFFFMVVRILSSLWTMVVKVRQLLLQNITTTLVILP